MRAAICYSGHLRDMEDCFPNHTNNLFSVLQNQGYDLDFFVSTWNCKGHRSHGWGGNTDINFVLSNVNPVAFLSETFSRDYFIQNYQSEQWKNYSHLSNHTTCGDSVSMWYIAQKCIDLVKSHEKRSGVKYDIIVRIRPDILFNDPMSPLTISEIVSRKSVHIPKWAGKWPEVSFTTTDYFAIGDNDSMTTAMSVFSNIDALIGDLSIPHTGEGFFYGQLKGLNVERLPNSFSVKRPDHVEFIV